MSEHLTIDELLAEITAAVQDAEGHTAEEWATQMGCSLLLARRKIKTLINAGKMGLGHAARMRMDGRMARVPVYRIL